MAYILINRNHNYLLLFDAYDIIGMYFRYVCTLFTQHFSGDEGDLGEGDTASRGRLEA